MTDVKQKPPHKDGGEDAKPTTTTNDPAETNEGGTGGTILPDLDGNDPTKPPKDNG